MDKTINRSVLVIYEDEEARTAAMSFCDHLIERFWARCAFDIEWVSFSQLKEAARAERAAEHAASANAIVFATEPWGWLPAEVRRWVEGWILRRGDREGVLIGLGDPVSEGSDLSNKFTWIRGVARRAGLDYLTQAPEELDTISDSPDSYTQRAAAVTTVLDEILRYHPLPGRNL